MNKTSRATLIVSIIFPFLALVFVALRFAARRVRSTPKADDWCIAFALFICFGLGINTTIGVANGVIGYSAAELGPDKASEILKIIYADTAISFVALATVKVAVLQFYKRIFIFRDFVVVANTMIIAIICWFIASIFALLFSQSPIRAHWSLDVVAKNNINFSAFLLTHASLDLLFDIIILCLPIPAILKLRMSNSKKVGIVGVFWLGSFCAVAESVRLYYLHLLIGLTEHAGIESLAFGSVVSNCLIWSRIEPCCSIIAACLPTLGPLVKEGRTPQSIMASIRSVLSLHSFRGSLRAKSSKSSLEDTKNWHSATDAEEGRKAWAIQKGSGITTIEMDPTYRAQPGPGEILTETTFASQRL